VGPEGAEIVEYSDMILGLDPQAEFRDTQIELPENSALVAYTDGLSEQVLITNEMAGEAGILEAAQQAFKEEDPIAAILQSILLRSKNAEFGDDILVFWLQRTGLNWFAPFPADRP
jgi:serine phosphatase RsbU (regulator of sigma subunit)